MEESFPLVILWSWCWCHNPSTHHMVQYLIPPSVTGMCYTWQPLDLLSAFASFYSNLLYISCISFQTHTHTHTWILPWHIIHPACNFQLTWHVRGITSSLPYCQYFTELQSPCQDFLFILCQPQQWYLCTYSVSALQSPWVLTRLLLRFFSSILSP